MKKGLKKGFMKSIAIAGAALSLSLLAACGNTPKDVPAVDSGVVKAFHAVAPAGDFISQTAVAEGQEYLVTVITPSSVAQYRVGADFRVNGTDEILGDAPALTALTDEVGAPLSDLERAYEEALKLSGVDRSEVDGFDFDRDVYMGKQVVKVEIEDATAEYSYTFDAADFTLLSSKTELKNTAPSQDGSSYIGEERAKAVALSAAGAEESEAQNLTVKNVLKNGKRLYEVDFLFEGYRYNVEIYAATGADGGKIVKFSKSVPDENAAYPEIPQSITEEQAKQIALAFVYPDGAPETSVSFRKVKLDYEKGRFVYEVEFVADGNEYEFEISAADGAILDVEIEAHGGDVPQGEKFITREEAVQKALAEAGEGAFLVEVDIEKETIGGVKRYFYEVEVKVNGRELEYHVDAITGEVTLNEGYAGNPANPNPALTEQEALAIALKTFGLTEDELTLKKIKLEREDGRLCYEIKLFVGTTEYKMSVDAQSGLVLEQEIDREHEQELPPQTPSQYLTPDEAAEKVKDYFAGKGKTARIKEVELEDEGSGANKRYYYEVEAVVDGREYECYVDVTTGDVKVKGELVQSGKPLIGEQEALAIALRYFSLTEGQARVIKVKLEEDDGILIYEVEFKVRDLEYACEIDAQTGEILDVDISFD